MSNLYVTEIIGKGRGVFTYVPIARGQLIESCEIIRVPGEQQQYLRSTVLADYYFLWHEDPRELAIALGNGSLYNHSFRPNARYDRNYETSRIDFVALRDIEKGEEITVNYNGDPEDVRPLWFKSI